MTGRPPRRWSQLSGAVQVVARLLIATAMTVAGLLALGPPVAGTQRGARGVDAGRSVVRSVDDLELRFTGTIRPDYLTVTLRSADGTDHALSPPQLEDDDATVRIRPTAHLPDGRYRASFQVVLADNDPGAGVVEFEVSSTGVSQAPPWLSGDTAPEPPRPCSDIGNPLPLVVGAVVVVAGFTAILVWNRKQRPDEDD